VEKNGSTVVERVTQIELFADISCPFTHVGLQRLVTERDARGSSAGVRARAWPLEWINGRQLAPEPVAAEIAGLRARVAPDLFRGFDAERWPHTTIPALGLAAAAYEQDLAVGERLSLRLREALFEEGRDISDDAELRALGRPFGVEPMAPLAAEAAVRADWERGRTRGVRGSPHFFVGSRNWFCPSLRIRHEGVKFDIAVDTTSLERFYASALG
jgi:predicted DsbA family dithiol-disulfide isomerase